MSRFRYVAVLVGCLGLISSSGRAGEPPEPSDAPPVADEEGESSADTQSLERARALFREGAELARQALWADALKRYEASASLAPHPSTTYNIGVCHRALGRFLLARASFRRALAQQGGEETKLAPSTVTDIEAFLGEIDGLLATLDVRLEPASASIAVDGRPLRPSSRTAQQPLYVAGVLPPGKGRPPAASLFRIELDPGPHVFVLSRAGFADAVVRRAVAPGSRGKLELSLERLPAELRINASEAMAAVSLDGLDVGVAPVTLRRPAGQYHVLVRKDGFDPYETDVTLEAAQRTDLMARLTPEDVGLHERWWFWTAIGTAVAAAVVVTYVATRPEPERPPVDGGGLGWSVRLP